MKEMRRPTPEELLSQLKSQPDKGEGTLKIFFGYAAGVGKTYAMLEAAHRAKNRAWTWSSATWNRTRAPKR